ncbi:MAG TPA: ferrochelatase, partial [Aliiroseovarius sp.]|nr:ferrochelatase [Aliiroseovarius sp.]
DCLETLEEINGEIREAFLEAGGERFTYIPALNTNPDHLDMIEAITLDNLRGWLD